MLINNNIILFALKGFPLKAGQLDFSTTPSIPQSQFTFILLTFARVLFTLFLSY